MKRIVAFFILVAGVQIFLAAVSVRNISRSREASDWVNHTNALILEVDGVDASFQAAEGKLRTYVMTGAVNDLTAAREELSAVREHVDIAQALARDDPDQRAEIERIDGVVSRRATDAQALIAARQSQGSEGALALLAGESWATAGSDLRGEVDRFKAGQMDLLAARDTDQYLKAQTTRWTVWSGVGVNLLILAGIIWLIRDDRNARTRASAALAEANRGLETRVRERTTELADANSRLSTENLERRWANLALEHQLRYNRLIVESISDLVLVLTKAMNVSRVNPAVLRATGWEQGDVINRPFASLVRLAPFPPGQSPPLFDPLMRALQEGRDLSEQEGVLTDRRGRDRPVRFSLYPLRDGNKVVGGVAVVRRQPATSRPGDSSRPASPSP